MKRLSLYIDFVFCLVVLPAMILLFPVERWFYNFPVYVVSVGVWLYTLYAVNRTATVPCLFGSRRRVFAAVGLIAVSVLVTWFFASYPLYTPKPDTHDVGLNIVLPHALQYQQAVWTLFLIVEAFSCAVGLLTQTNIQRARRRAVEAEREKAEIKLYRAQIKPHFMFNTLNTLYGLFLTRHENALPSFEKFIAMMRYVQTASMRDFVSLAEEADYIARYVALQKLRLNGMTSVSLEIDLSDGSLPVPPMLVVTFVENCFKHGVSSVEPCEIIISMRERDRRLEFTTANRIFPATTLGEHTGIENCRRRLALLYPGRHKLKITDNGSTFDLSLQIDLTV